MKFALKLIINVITMFALLQLSKGCLFIFDFFFSLSTNQPDRIRQFGVSRRKEPQVLEPIVTGESESSSRGLSNHEKTGVVRDREMPPPDQPHVAFQSPVLEYNSALGLGGGALSPNIQPAAPSFPRALDTPRYQLLIPHNLLFFFRLFHRQV